MNGARGLLKHHSLHQNNLVS